MPSPFDFYRFQCNPTTQGHVKLHDAGVPPLPLNSRRFFEDSKWDGDGSGDGMEMEMEMRMGIGMGMGMGMGIVKRSCELI